MSVLQLKGCVCTLLEVHLLHAGGACLKRLYICRNRDEGLCQYFARKGMTVWTVFVLCWMGFVCTVIDSCVCTVERMFLYHAG